MTRTAHPPRGEETINQIRHRAIYDARHVIDTHKHASTDTVVTLARRLGANVFTADLPEGTLGTVIGAFGGPDIYINSNQPRTLSQYACARALGHSIDHASRMDPIAEGQGYEIHSGWKNTAEVIYADIFAQTLLYNLA